MDVSIIIVNYNTSDLLIECIKSIYKKTSDLKFEIIIVDNASSDNSVANVKSNFKDVKLIDSKINLGFGRANNLGATLATGKYMFLLNSDTLLVNNAILKLFNFMELYSDKLSVGACGGNLFNLDMTPNFSYSNSYPTIWSVFLYKSGLGKFLKKKSNFNFSEENMEVPIIIGADLFIKTSLFNKLRGFDEFFFMYIEDGELQWRIKKMGYHIYSVPSSEIIHIQGASSATLFKLENEFIGYKYFFKKHFGIFCQKIYIVFEVILTVLKCIYFIFVDKNKFIQYRKFLKIMLGI
ncbi:glycosyltransferase family 2 protein [uncultured Chryseobacterium sp.]|uniref:glycosyltransferase family 2 protein n=1 Tax=uncultured Chryseobacterium sp. TaxID=259322 RepID=UPI0025D2F1BB|nr:glycosyltransferase family 2 protein [uncultured Chryseobacterium sp.]